VPSCNLRVTLSIVSLLSQFNIAMPPRGNYSWYAAGIPQPDQQVLTSRLAPIFSQVEAMAGFKESMKVTEHTPTLPHRDPTIAEHPAIQSSRRSG